MGVLTAPLQCFDEMFRPRRVKEQVLDDRVMRGEVGALGILTNLRRADQRIRKNLLPCMEKRIVAICALK